MGINVFPSSRTCFLPFVRVYSFVYIVWCLNCGADAQRAAGGSGEGHRRPDAGEGQRARKGEGEVAKEASRPGGARGLAGGLGDRKLYRYLVVS